VNKKQYIWTGPRDLVAGELTIKSMQPFSFDGPKMAAFGGLVHSSPNRMMPCAALERRARDLGAGNLRTLLRRAGFDVFGDRDQLESALVRHIRGEDIEKQEEAPKTMTKAEARRSIVADMIGEGAKPGDIAKAVGVSLQTVRKDIQAVQSDEEE